MTPLQLMMMLHYHAISAPYAEHDPCHAKSSAVKSQRDELVASGLLEHTDAGFSGFLVTARGAAYVKALQDMPLPVCTWVIPR